MLHEVQTIYMMQQINTFESKSTHYETRYICSLKHISRNSLTVLRGEMCNFKHCCRVFHQFKWNDYNKLYEYISWMCSERQICCTQYCIKHVSCNMFHRCAPHLKWIYFLIRYYNIFNIINLWSPLAPLLG